MGATLSAELQRRHANVHAAMAAHDLDALIVSGSEYSGFEGAVTYMSGFQIVHRYAYVVVPADGEAFVAFPTEARYVGEHGTAELEQVFHDRPGELIKLLQLGAEERANVVSVEHHREGMRLPIGQTEVELTLAMRDEAHCDELRATLAERGYPAERLS